MCVQDQIHAASKILVDITYSARVIDVFVVVIFLAGSVVSKYAGDFFLLSVSRLTWYALVFKCVMPPPFIFIAIPKNEWIPLFHSFQNGKICVPSQRLNK